MASGPLVGVKVVEFAGIGPGPFCGMLLSDLGADVIRIDRTGAQTPNGLSVIQRGRRSVALNLKAPAGIETCLALLERADASIEVYRPGVMERLGLGPEVALKRNPRLIYGRMTGWGQSGPLAQAAGHDINYIALTGALHAIGPQEKPMPPLNLVGDFGGGALYLAMGLLAGILNARSTGVGQVIDCAMTDGAASLMAPFYGLFAAGAWKDRRNRNRLDGGAYYYDTYECSDGKWIAIGSLEPQFYALLLEKLGLDSAQYALQTNPTEWSRLRAKFVRIFRTRSRAQWCAIMEGTDVCFAPVLSLQEAPQHPHNVARQTFVERDGVVQPAPAPRFSVTPGVIQRSAPEPGEHSEEVLRDWGLTPAAG